VRILPAVSETEGRELAVMEKRQNKVSETEGRELAVMEKRQNKANWSWC
jgi:hypothetical protein